jgi:hypothetical protein
MKQNMSGFIWLRIGSLAEFCEEGNEPSGFIKCCEFLDHLSKRELPKKDCVAFG